MRKGNPIKHIHAPTLLRFAESCDKLLQLIFERVSLNLWLNGVVSLFEIRQQGEVIQPLVIGVLVIDDCISGITTVICSDLCNRLGKYTKAVRNFIRRSQFPFSLDGFSRIEVARSIVPL